MYYKFYKILITMCLSIIFLFGTQILALAEQPSVIINPIHEKISNKINTKNKIHLDLSIGQFLTNGSTKNEGNLFSTSIKLTDVINNKFSVFVDFTENNFNRSQSNFLNAARYNASNYDLGFIYKFDDRTWVTFSNGTNFRVNVVPGQSFTNKFIGVTLTHRIF